MVTLQAIEKRLVTVNEATTISYGRRGLNLAGKIHYTFIVMRAYFKILRFYKAALIKKECYYGPFKGEFGHFLLHNLPFLSHLYSRGVKIHYCGMEIHRPFLKDEMGNDLITSFHALRDFFGEVAPHSNETIPPIDVQESIDQFKNQAELSGLPYLDISDKDLYWYVFRNWQLDGHQCSFNLQKVYQTAVESSCVIFPRKKGNAITPNNGGPWDYAALAAAVAPYFDKVYVTGHPAMSAVVPTNGNVELCLSSDNKVVLEKCANASLIITQHSGAVHLGGYTQTPVLVLFNGHPPVKGLIDTIRFRKNLTTIPLSYAFTEHEVVSHVSNIKKIKNA